MDREKRIKELARKYENRKRRSRGNSDEAWDKAGQQVEREGSEASRGPVKPDLEIENRNA